LAGLPYSKFFWNDYAGDQELRLCSLAAQGFWMRLLCIAGQSIETGFVLLNGKKPTDEDLVKVTGATLEEVVSLRRELIAKGVCSKDRRDVLYCRRMVNEEKKRSKSRDGGKIGGPASLDKQKGIHATRGDTRAPYSKPESRVHIPDSRLLECMRLFCSELGQVFDPSGPAHLNWSSALRRMMVDDGLDLELDILPVVKSARASGRLPAEIKTPNLFREGALMMHAQRVTGQPVPTVQSNTPKVEDLSRPDWAKRLARFLECGIWIGPGPNPTCRGCVAPLDMLVATRKRWHELGNHPEYADMDCNFPWKPEGASMRGVIFPAAKAVDADDVEAKLA
jgi:hypothetical protein